MDRVMPFFERLISRLFIAVVVVAAILLSFPKAFADKFNTELASEVRSLGMGDAGVNTSRGPYAVFYNPANIATKDTKDNIELVNIQLDGTDGLLAKAGRAKFPNFTGLGSLYGNLKETPNTYVGGRYSLYPNITIRNFSIGMLYEVNQGALLRADDGALRVKARDRFAPTVAISERFFSGILRLGASAQLVTVGDSSSVIAAPIPQALDFGNYINSMSGFVFNGGTTVTLPFRYLPSFSIVGRNIGNTNYSMAPYLMRFGSVRESFLQQMSFDFGSSMTVFLGRRLEMKLALDYRDLTNRNTGGRFRHVFAGSEFIFYDLLKLRVGIAHGYLSYGLGLETPKASLELAAYADELDDKLRGSKEQHYVIQYTWGIFK